MKENIKFEEAMKLLEDSVRSLESGTLSLDESISKYEEAIKYIKICNESLEKAEQKVKILTEGPDGAIYDRPFINDEN